MIIKDAESAWVRSYSQGRHGLELPETLPFETVTGRAAVDARAAWTRWHDQSCARGFEPEQWRWYQILEQARVDTLASADLPGIALNLSLAEQLPEQADPSALIVYRVARKCFQQGHQADVGPERAQITKRTSLWTKLSNRIRPIRRCRSVVEQIDLNWLVPQLIASQSHLQNTAAFSRKMVPIARQLAGFAPPAADDNEALEEDAENAATDLKDSEDQESDTAQAFGGEQAVPEISRRFPDYRVYSSELDEIAAAQRWYRASDAEALQQLDRMDRREANRLAHRLQRQLQSLRLRRWSFDQDEGSLDSRRLARLVGDRPDHRVFRVESQSRVPEASITFLVDQSGSMRGDAHLLAAQALDLAVHTLEVCGLSTEVLGYTTVTGKQDHNAVWEQWRAAGARPAPGRLNSLRHIILKSSSQPWRRARRYLGLLLRADFGRENIDGESLYWAYERTMARPEQRKILIVLCDGVPYDQTTVEANGREFLLCHLQSVVDLIAAGPIHLLAVGTGRDVSRYYPNTVIVRKPEKIAEILFSGIANALEFES